MKPVLRHLHSPDVQDLQSFVPPPTFSILVQLIVGPSDGPGEESFDVLLCSPQWLAEREKPTVGCHHLIVPKYDYDVLLAFLDEYLEGCEGRNWDEVAAKVGRLGKWEFEGYQESSQQA